MTVLDTTVFSQDFNALELRIQELWSEVDTFIVCESNFTHSGEQKELLLSQSGSFVSQYKEKLKVIQFICKKPHANPRTQEMLQREFISGQLKILGVKSSDVIIHSDCDEIPRSEVVQSARKEPSNLLLNLRNYTYFLNLRNGNYLRGRILWGRFFKGIQNMRKDIFSHNLLVGSKRQYRFARVPDFWTTRRKFINVPELILYPRGLKVINDAGWHFNNLMTPDEIAKKISWSSHAELNDNKIRNLQEIERKIINKEDVYFGKKFEIERDFLNLPKTVQKNPDRWKTYLLE